MISNKRYCNGMDLMVDIETLGVNANAPIISIGAVLFDPRDYNSFDSLRERSFYASVSIEDAVAVCGKENIDGGTIAWWFQQDPAAIKRLVSGHQENLNEALHGLWRYSHARTDKQPEWLRTAPIPQVVWAKSPSFDMKIIRSACDKLRIAVPFHFANEQDVRTAQLLAWPDGEVPKLHEGVAHDARDDAVAQAMVVQAAYREIGISYDKVKYA